jgi:hypothetical protein
MAGMTESVIVAVKKGTSASGKDTLTLKVLESFGVNSKRARCLGISMGYRVSEHECEKKDGLKNVLQFLRPFQTL